MKGFFFLQSLIVIVMGVFWGFFVVFFLNNVVDIKMNAYFEAVETLKSSLEKNLHHNHIRYLCEMGIDLI